MANPSKFYSTALEIAKAIEQKSGKAGQFRSMLLNKGAKPSELDYIGVDELLRDPERKIKRDELVDYIDENQVKPEETFYTGEGATDEEGARISEIADSLMRANSADEGEAEFAKKMFGELTGVEWEPHYSEFQNAMSPEMIAQGFGTDSPEWERLGDEAYATAREMFGGPGGNTKWSQYVTGEPSDQYTEHLVTLPLRESDEQLKRNMKDTYFSPHWEEPNVLAHMRYDYDPDALRLEEIQSDWLQQMREAGGPRDPGITGEMLDEANSALSQRSGALNAVFRRLPRLRNRHDIDWDRVSPEDSELYAQLSDEYNEATDARDLLHRKYQAPPRAPLANVNDWTGMMLRRAMLEAAEKDKAKIRWTSGASQDRRYSLEPGRAKYYDEIIPNIANKIVRPYGGSRAVPEYWEGGGSEVTGGPDMHVLDLPPKLIEALQKRGKVPFFKRGGKVERLPELKSFPVSEDDHNDVSYAQGNRVRVPPHAMGVPFKDGRVTKVERGKPGGTMLVYVDAD